MDKDLKEKNALTMPELCEYLGGIVTSTLYETVLKRGLKTFRIGNRRMCLRSEADKYIEEHSEVE